MFKNKHTKASKYNTEFYQKRSRLFRPKTRTSSIHFDADLARAFFSTSRLTRVLPENKKDPIAVAGAAVGSELVSYHLKKSIPWRKLVVGAGQEAWKMGDIISHQGWCYEVDTLGNVRKDIPKVTLIPSENLRLSEAADWEDPINTSPFVIWVDHMYVCDIEDRILLGEGGKAPGWFPLTDGEILAARDFEWNTTRQERNPNGVDPVTEPKPITDYDIIPVHKNFMTEDGETYVYYTLGHSTMLSDPVLLEEEYPQGMPFVQGNLLINPFTTYHEGMPELGQPIQEEINNVANDRIDNVHLVLNKRYFAKRGRNVDFRSLLRNISGSISMMDDPNEDVRVVETSDVTASSYMEQDKLDTDFDELIGAFSPVVQNQAGQAAGGSVGGMSMAQAGSASVTEFMLENFHTSWVEPVIAQLVSLIFAFESEKTINSIVKDTEALEVLQGSGEPIEDIMSRISVEVNVGISATNPQMKVEKMLYGLSALGQVHQSPMAARLDIDEISNEIFSQLGFRNNERFFKDDPTDPVVAQLEDQVQQLQSQLDSKMQEIEARNAVDREKLQFEVGKYQNEQASREAEVNRTNVETQKLMTEIEALYHEMQLIGSGDFDLAKLQLEYDKLKQQQYEFQTTNQTERDKILAEWQKASEDLRMKLLIVQENNKQNDGDENRGVSKETATVSKNAIQESAK